MEKVLEKITQTHDMIADSKFDEIRIYLKSFLLADFQFLLKKISITKFQ